MRRTLALLGATALLLTACEAPAVYGPSPTPTVAPIFASEEEAEAAVAEFMSEYLGALSEFFRSRGESSDRLEELASPEQLSDERDGLEDQVARDLTPTGSYSYFGLELQQLHQESDGSASVQAYICIDYRQSAYTRADGSQFAGEVEWSPAEVILTAQRDERMVLEELRHWSGRDFCASS